jgi:hypothetical protein
VYTGLAIGVSSAGPTLYAANFSQGTIDTWDKNWKPITLPGGFQDQNLPGGPIRRISSVMAKAVCHVNFSDGAGSFAWRPRYRQVNTTT